MIVNHGKSNRSTVELPGLSEVVGCENDAIRRLGGWVADVHVMPAAKVALSHCTSTELLAAIAFGSANAASRVQ
jgi:hypothetical protein